jgi:phosphoglycolate phosphatase-like HAD superfamily hydrolase
LIRAILWDVDGTLAETERAGLRMAIVTTTTRSNVDALLATHLGKGWKSAFAAVGPSLGCIDGWRPSADAGSKRIDLEQISRWYAQCER